MAAPRHRRERFVVLVSVCGVGVMGMAAAEAGLWCGCRCGSSSSFGGRRTRLAAVAWGVSAGLWCWVGLSAGLEVLLLPSLLPP